MKVSYCIAILALCGCCTAQLFSVVSNSVPQLLGVLSCTVDDEPVTCAREKGGRLLDRWEDGLSDEMVRWEDEADHELVTSGRQLSSSEEKPASIAYKIQLALNELATILQKSIYNTMARKKHSDGGIDSITISTSEHEHMKKDKKKKKKKTPQLHIHQQQQQNQPEEVEDNKEEDKGWTPMTQDAWVMEEKELQGPQKIRIKRADDPESDQESRDVGDARGKKKKRKKAILKLLLLGAVLKAKIGLLLQLFTAHLQVKFFAIALAGLALNIARFWLDLKKGHQPQKVIYYEHAQHQHHYDHEDEGGWGGYWSRSIDAKPEKKVVEYPEVASSGDDLAFGGWTGRSRRTRRHLH